MMQLDAPASRYELTAALGTLARAGWFSDRSERTRALIGTEARLRRFRPGEALYHVGDAPNGLYGLVEGALRISVPRDDGEDYVIHRADPGFWIGDAAQFSDDARLVTLIAVAHTTVVHIPAEALERLVDAEPRLYRDFYALTHWNLRTALRLFVNTLVPESDLRVALRLLHQDELAGQTERGVALAQAEFADLVGLSLPTLQRALRRLAEAGLVELGYGRIRILDRAGLLRRCLR
ncbi:Crp/Fnr family transcriptional regulator [Rubrimonas sp.]|uniref:Crp/Fnr family transcriptional regulator n=1 Tax=Rubrimonas sp. TaxID=2036015 RepID=UPI002FDECD77